MVEIYGVDNLASVENDILEKFPEYEIIKDKELRMCKDIIPTIGKSKICATMWALDAIKMPESKTLHLIETSKSDSNHSLHVGDITIANFAVLPMCEYTNSIAFDGGYRNRESLLREIVNTYSLLYPEHFELQGGLRDDELLSVYFFDIPDEG